MCIVDGDLDVGVDFVVWVSCVLLYVVYMDHTRAGHARQGKGDTQDDVEGDRACHTYAHTCNTTYLVLCMGVYVCVCAFVVCVVLLVSPYTC
jgi:hypothetical protein